MLARWFADVVYEVGGTLMMATAFVLVGSFLCWVDKRREERSGR